MRSRFRQMKISEAIMVVVKMACSREGRRHRQGPDEEVVMAEECSSSDARCNPTF